MNQITIRGIPADVERAIRKESEETQLSLNKTIINMLKRAVEIAEQKRPKKHRPSHNFDKYFGGWSDEETAAFNKIIEEDFEQIDEEGWK